MAPKPKSQEVNSAEDSRNEATPQISRRVKDEIEASMEASFSIKALFCG
jgi:hypothetical protein